MFCFLILSAYFLPFPHFSGTILLIWRLMKNFYFLSHFHTNVYVKFFIKELRLFCSWSDPISAFSIPLSEKYGNVYSTEKQVVSFTAVFQLQHSYEYAHWSSFKNRSKWASVETYRRRFSAAFRTTTVKYTHRWLLPKYSWSSFYCNIRKVSRKANVMESF